MSSIEIGVWDDDGGGAPDYQNVSISLRKWLFTNGATRTWMYGHASILNEDGTVTIKGKECVPPEKIVRMVPSEMSFLTEGKELFGFESEAKSFRAEKAVTYRRFVEKLEEEL